MRFLTEVDTETRLVGTLIVRFDGSLSGLQGVMLHDPLGRPRADVGADIKTSVRLDFDFNLRTLQDQATVVEKSPIPPKDVSPGHQMVTEIIENIGTEGFYVKRVIENPAYTTKAGAHVLNRFWDLAGRKYDGLYPMDFHLVLAGEEVYGPDGHPQSGNTQIEVTVQGIATNDEMRAQIGNLKDQLVHLIEKTLSSPEADDLPPPDSVAPIPEPPHDGHHGTGRVQSLGDRLVEALEKMLIEQGISKQTAKAMCEEYRRELDDLLEAR